MEFNKNKPQPARFDLKDLISAEYQKHLASVESQNEDLRKQYKTDTEKLEAELKQAKETIQQMVVSHQTTKDLLESVSNRVSPEIKYLIIKHQEPSGYDWSDYLETKYIAESVVVDTLEEAQTEISAFNLAMQNRTPSRLESSFSFHTILIPFIANQAVNIDKIESSLSDW